MATSNDAYQTPQGRAFADTVNAAAREADTLLNRLQSIGKQFHLYPRNQQVDLADVTMIYAFSVLAADASRADCKAYLSATIDFMYTQTGDAGVELDEREHYLLGEESQERIKKLLPSMSAVLKSSARSLSALDADNTVRMTAESMHLVRQQFLDFVPSQMLPDLIFKALQLAIFSESHHVGAKSSSDVSSAMQSVLQLCTGIANTVLAEVEKGNLEVRDGVVDFPSDPSEP